MAVLLAAAGSLATWGLGRIGAHLSHGYEMDRRRLEREEAEADRERDEADAARRELLDWAVPLNLLFEADSFLEDEMLFDFRNPYRHDKADGPSSEAEFLIELMRSEFDPRLPSEVRAAVHDLRKAMEDTPVRQPNHYEDAASWTERAMHLRDLLAEVLSRVFDDADTAA